MKAFLCAAGRGTRISKMFPNKAKCTLDVDGLPLIRRTVRMLCDRGIETTVVVGYRQEDVREALEGLQVHFVYNPFFDVTNSIGSLWMAREGLTEEDTIIANADVFWSPGLLDLLLADPPENCMLGDVTRAEDGDFFFLEKDGILLKYGKELKREERNTEYVGITFLRHDFVPVFRKRLEEMVAGQQHNVWWENVLYSMIGERTVYVRDVDGMFWAEVDFIEDYQRILRYIKRTGS